MNKNHHKTKSDETKRLFRPLAYIDAFFHPVSRSSLEETFKRTQDILDRTERLIKESDELHRQVDRSLATDNPIHINTKK